MRKAGRTLLSSRRLFLMLSEMGQWLRIGHRVARPHSRSGLAKRFGVSFRKDNVHRARMPLCGASYLHIIDVAAVIRIRIQDSVAVHVEVGVAREPERRRRRLRNTVMTVRRVSIKESDHI